MSTLSIQVIVIANPKWVRAVQGHKDDAKDSKWITELFCFGLVKGSFIPGKDIRILREFTRYRAKLTNMRSSEKNRFQNGFTVCNSALDICSANHQVFADRQRTNGAVLFDFAPSLSQKESCRCR